MNSSKRSTEQLTRKKPNTKPNVYHRTGRDKIPSSCNPNLQKSSPASHSVPLISSFKVFATCFSNSNTLLMFLSYSKYSGYMIDISSTRFQIISLHRFLRIFLFNIDGGSMYLLLFITSLLSHSIKNIKFKIPPT